VHPERPQIRASYLQSSLAALARLDAREEAQVRARFGAAQIERVESAVRMSFLPLELDVALTEAVERVCGRPRALRWNADAVVYAARGPLLGPVRLALLRLGMTPHAALRQVPRAWGLVYHACGFLGYERCGETEARLVHLDVPELVLSSDAYPHGIAGAFEGVIEVGGGRGSVQVELDRPRARITYLCAWSGHQR
jgi:hypothetical protein